MASVAKVDGIVVSERRAPVVDYYFYTWSETFSSTRPRCRHVSQGEAV